MATLVFSAIGTALGGPLGGALGALAGRQVDSLIMPRPRREGPRLTELAISTSSYGAAIPRHFGRMRVAGTVIWATDLAEHEARTGGKGQPATTTYSYSASFAVALSSRPVAMLGRIWADGKLLRGAAGDLKVSGTLRLHQGHPDQEADSLIASAEAPGLCPAYRGLAYVVFEDLALADFGNRIPALTFEVIADNDLLSASQLLETVDGAAAAQDALAGFRGLSLDSAPAELLVQLNEVVPLDCHAAAGGVGIGQSAAMPVLVGPAAASPDDGGAIRQRGEMIRHRPAEGQPVGLLRYYDPERDFQPGAQRAFGVAAAGEVASLDLPAAMAADHARSLIEQLAARRAWARQVLVRRQADLDPALVPGQLVTLPDQAGQWKIAAWEWRAGGVEIELVRAAASALPLPSIPASSGRAGTDPDLATGPSVIQAFELPLGTPQAIAEGNIWVAAASSASGWRGGALFAETADGNLLDLARSVRRKAIMGQAVTVLPPHSPHVLDRTSRLLIDLIDPAMVLEPAGTGQLLQGANLALVGGELVQFGQAEPLGGTRWRLSMFARGRGGLELAVSDHAAGEPFVKIDQRIVAIPRAELGLFEQMAIIGQGDSGPAFAPVLLAGSSTAPPPPVHGRIARLANGDRVLSWIRRSRCSWVWPEQVEVPLSEETEAWQVEFLAGDNLLARWQTQDPKLVIGPPDWSALLALAPAGCFMVRQVGTYALSAPLVINPPSGLGS